MIIRHSSFSYLIFKWVPETVGSIIEMLYNNDMRSYLDKPQTVSSSSKFWHEKRKEYFDGTEISCARVYWTGFKTINPAGLL